MKIKSVAFTEKGQIRPAVRKAVIEHIAANPAVFAEAVRVGDKGVFTVEVADSNGDIFFVNFDVTVSNKAAADRAERKPRVKAAASGESIDID